MSSYKKNASANRDSLFGNAAGGGGDNKKKKSASRSSSRTSSGSGSGGGGGSRPKASTANKSRGYQPAAAPATTTGGGKKEKKQIPQCVLSEEAQAAKLKEVDDYKKKAGEAMTKSYFSRPDPVAASTYYKRAADCYKALCDLRLERLYRLESAKCNRMIGAWASAAADFSRAAELALLEGESGSDGEGGPRNASEHYKQAGEMWTQQNEKAKAAGCLVKSALALNAGQPGSMLSRDALAGMEEAVEAHVPDVLNPFARYRQTGVSAYVDPNDPESDVSNPGAQMLELANTHMVSRSYAHEPLLDVVNTLSDYGEYASALYACGAARAILAKDGISTLTLGRVYVIETILMLAMGDPIAAEQVFLNKHVQSTPYLSSRECKLGEDLFRAVKMRDAEALEEARSTSGSNRAGLANLHPSLQNVVQQIRLSGVARKTADSESAAAGKGRSTNTTSSSSSPEKKKKKKKKPSSSSSREGNKSEEEAEANEPSLKDVLNMKTGYEKEAEEGENLDGDALSNELDGLDFGDDDDDGSLGSDDFDLR